MLQKGAETDAIDKNAIDPHRWVSMYADYLYTYAAFRINDQDMAKDLVQETFLAALESREKFKRRSSEKTWLTAILKNKIIDVYRSRSSGFGKDLVQANINAPDEDFFNPDNVHWNDQHLDQN